MDRRVRDEILKKYYPTWASRGPPKAHCGRLFPLTVSPQDVPSFDPGQLASLADIESLIFDAAHESLLVYPVTLCSKALPAQ